MPDSTMITRNIGLMLSLLTLGLGEVMISVPSSVTATPLIAQNTDNQLTEAKVRDVIKAIDQAQQEENQAVLLSYLLPYTVSEIAVESQGKTTTSTLEGIAAHQQLLEKMFEQINNRKTLSEYLTIRMTPDNQLAIATRMTTKELTSKEGQRFISSGTDIFRIAWVNNQPKVISIKSQGWIEERPKTPAKNP
ncbi:MAG: hypothetical protein ACKN9E_01960 [Microcystaceae cyanobacterium]